MTDNSRPPRSARFLRPNSTVLTVVVALLVLGVVVCAFIPSFEAQMHLATTAGIPAVASFAWPTVVDGTVIVSTLAALVLRGRKGGFERAYPWIVLLVFATITILTNGLNSSGLELTVGIKFALGAVPPVGLVLSTHLLVVILDAGDENTTAADVPTLGELVDEAEPAPRKLPVLEEAVVHPMAVPTPLSIRAPAAQASADDARVRGLILSSLADGVLPSGAMVGDWLGKSSRSGQRFLGRFLEEDDAAAAAVAQLRGN